MVRRVSANPDMPQIVGDIRARVLKRDWSRAFFARQIGFPDDKVRKIFLLREHRDVNARFLKASADVLGVSLDAFFANCPRRRPMWNSATDKPQLLLDLYNEHEARAQCVDGFNTIMPSFALTPTMQRRGFASLCQQIDATPAQERRWNLFGDGRRAHVHSHGLSKKHAHIMLQANVEDVVWGRWPFDQATNEERCETLEYLRDDCIEALGYELSFVDERTVPAPLLLRLRQQDSVTPIGDSLALCRTNDYTVVFAEDRQAVAESLSLIGQLRHCGANLLTAAAIDAYLRDLDRQRKAGLPRRRDSN